MYVYCSIEAHSFNHCCSGKSRNITHVECVFVDFGIHHAMRMPHIVVCGLPASTTFFHIISLMAWCSKYKFQMWNMNF